jgi:hypothetical protein
VDAGEGCCYAVGPGSAFGEVIKGLALTCGSSAAARDLPGMICLTLARLCAHWENFINHSNFAWRKMWLFCIVTIRCCSEFLNLCDLRE